MAPSPIFKSPLESARLVRLGAKLIDLFIVLILLVFFYPLGVFLAAGYFCIADALYGGQSVGKRFAGFAVVSVEDGSPCTIKQSTIRNLPIIIPLGFFIIPIWGWFIAVFLGVPLICLEIYLVFALDTGHRLGDVMADTTVIAAPTELVAVKKIEHLLG